MLSAGVARRGLGALRERLKEPAVRNVDPESPAFVAAQRAVLARKRMLRDVFCEFYRACVEADRRWFTAAGIRVEVGAGVSFFKDADPAIVSTDIKPVPHLDMALDARHMPFADGSVRAVYAINCFHHLHDPEAFFRELERVLPPGGGSVLIEPYHGPAARLLYPRLHATECYDRAQAGWTRPDDDPRFVMTAANQALAYVVFVRDRERFAARHPALRMVDAFPLGNYLRYLLSGGLNFQAFVPGAATALLRAVETALVPLRPLLALHQVIVLRKEAVP